MKRVLDNISSWGTTAVLTVAFGYLITPSYGADVTLQWDANVESDLLGYKVYYHAGPSAPPYTGSEAREGDSPILLDADDVTMGDVCRFTLTGLTNTQTYYMVLTAYDTVGTESGFSNEVCFNYLPDEPVIHHVIPNSTPATAPGNPQKVKIEGLNFGQTQCTSTLHIGGKTWSEGHFRIKIWDNEEIKFKVPEYDPPFPKYRDVWVTVNGEDSNKIQLKIIAP